MSEHEIINDETIFQSFSKNHIFDSNKEPSKISKNENIEFTFRKNLFLQKSDETPPKTIENKDNHNIVSAFNDKVMDIYSKNDNNIQESGHFGKSKYDSNKYKNIIEKNNVSIQPLFFMKEKLCGKYSKQNLNIKKIEREESKLFNNQLKKVEIKKFKSTSKIKTNMNDINNSCYNNRSKNKKNKTDSTCSLKGNNQSINGNNNNYQISVNEEFNHIVKKKDSFKGVDPLINRLKKMKDNNYFKDIISTTFNNTNNNFINTQFIGNETRTFNNNFNIISINGYNNKYKKITTGRINDMQQKLNSNINNNSKQISRNSRVYKENKENIPNNIKNKRDILYNPKNINNTIMNVTHNRPPYFEEIKKNNFITERVQYNPQRIGKTKIINSKKENIINKSAYNCSKINEIRFNENKNNVLLSSTVNFENLMKNKIPQSNRNKNYELVYYNKSILMNNNNYIGAIKSKTNKSGLNVSKNKIPSKKMLIKSYFIKDNFGF